MKGKRGFRWALFAASVACFFYIVAIDSSPWAVWLFFLFGGLWYWLERRKTRELDALRPK